MQIERKQLTKPYMILIIVSGVVQLIASWLEIQISVFDFGFLLFTAATLGIGSRIVVQIPHTRGNISVSDTFILLAILLYGGGVATLLAAADALISSLRITKKKLVISFNVGVAISSTFLTALALNYFFGSITELTKQGYSPKFFNAVCLMALIQYVLNSGLVAVGVALRAGAPIYKMWKENFLWTSLTSIAGASAAAIIAQAINVIGIYAFLATVPIVAVLYFTYATYLKNVESAAEQAELAQKHVEELSHHIAEQERISRALEESEKYFRNAFDHAAGMAIVSPQGNWLQVNESLCAMLGFSPEELLAADLQRVTHESDLGNDLANLYQLLEGKISNYHVEKRFIHKFGHSVWVLQSASLIRNEDREERQVILQIQDISDRKRAEEQIHYAAFHDALTGLPNRTLLADRLSMAVERSKRIKEYQFAVLFIDLDRFKIVNDSLGHDMGDKLLIDLSRRLENCVRKMDTIARLGGDEFAVLVDDITDTRTAIEIAERIQEALKDPFDLDGHEFFTTASIGIAYSETGYERPEDILRDADTAMYRAKSNGKARHEVFDVYMHTRAIETLQLENDLRRAIENGEIVSFYQPVIDLKTEEITGFEALARWQHPKRGMISPVDFIPLAEETGLIVPLGLQMLGDACKQVYQWQNRYNRPFTISVNLSAGQFKQTGIVDKVTEALLESNLSASDLRLEITESVVMDNAAEAAEILKELKAIGIQLSIDDFGTGYSSLSYLHRFPFDIIKIDRSFVSRVITDRECRGIVKTIITLAQELDKSIIAEGVEKISHKDLLIELNCEYAQGYLFSRPLDVAGTEKLLEKGLYWYRKQTPALPVFDDKTIETFENSFAM